MHSIIISTRDSLHTCISQLDHRYEDKYTKHNIKLFSLNLSDFISHTVGFRMLVEKIIDFHDLDKESEYIIDFDIRKENKYAEYENFWTLKGRYKLNFARINSLNNKTIPNWLQLNNIDYDHIRSQDKSYQFYKLTITVLGDKGSYCNEPVGEYLVVYKYVDHEVYNEVNDDYSIQFYCAPNDELVLYNIVYDGICTLTFNKPGKRDSSISYMTETQEELKITILKFLEKYIKQYNSNTIESIYFIYNKFKIHSKNTLHYGNIILIEYDNKVCELLIALNTFVEIMMHILTQIELSMYS